MREDDQEPPAVEKEPVKTGKVDLKALGGLLEAERRRKLLSQRAALAQVRKRLGRVVAMTTLQKWEAGELRPEGEELVDYLCGLGASVEMLLALAKLFSPAPAGAPLDVSPERYERLLAGSPRVPEATLEPLLLTLLRCWVPLVGLDERLGPLEALQGRVSAPPSGSG